MKNKVFILIIGSVLWANLAIAQKLYVFVPSDMRAKVLQDKISEVCSGVEVTVFGRVRDFSKQLESNPPNAIMALAPVIESSTGYSRLLQGLRSGAEKEPYMLVSVGKEMDVAKLDSVKLGVIDILGRSDMNKYITKLLNKDVKLKRVTKLEDLLPLLTFNAVDAIFVSKSVYELIKTKTELDLKAKTLDVSIGLVSTAMTSDSQSEALTKCVNAFPQDINTAMGVDKWKSL